MFRSNHTHPANSISLLPHDIELKNPRKQSTQAHARKATLTWLLIHLPFGQNLLDGQPVEVLWSFTMNSLCSQVAVFDLVISCIRIISIHFVVTPPSDAEVAPQGCNSVPTRCKPHHPAVSSMLFVIRTWIQSVWTCPYHHCESAIKK